MRMLGAAWAQAGPWLRRKVREFGPAVLYAHHTGVNGYLAVRLQEEFGLPFLVTDHDFGEIQSCRAFPERRKLFGQVADRAFRMIAVARRMEREVGEQFPQARTETIPNGTEPIPEEIRQRPRATEREGRVTFFSCGAFYERKGFPLLVESFCAAAERNPALRLRIAGDGAERGRVEETVKRSRAGGQVELLGALPHEAVLQEMSWADGFVLTGWDEPFATVYLEAMSAGLPIVCCRDGGITDVLEHEVHGLTVAPKDGAAIREALERLADSAELRQRLGTAGRRLFDERLRWDQHAARMKALFAQAAAEGGPRAA
jgi:glycosyltransferase involved in cell wall biosynthesis